MRFGSVAGLAVLAAFGGCSPSGSPVANALLPTIVMPAGLLDSVVRLQVLAFDGASTTCTNPDTAGTVGGETSEVKALVNKDLGSTGCKPGEKFCGDLQIEPSDMKTRVFVANAYTADRKTVARGCQSLVVKSGSNQLRIKMFRLIPQAMCGGKPSPNKVVQCDQPGSPTDPVCDVDCLSKEQFLSPGSGNAGQTSSTKVKERASFVWPADADPTAGRFVAFAGDQSPPARWQVSMRVLDPDMLPCFGAKCVPDRGSFVQLYSFLVPNDPTNGDLASQVGDTHTQYNPSAVYAADKYFVAFEDGTGNTSRIALRTVTASLFAEQPPNQAIGLSTAAGHKRPSMALGAGGKLFVAWEANGEIRGRTVDPNACTVACTLGTEQLVGSGTRPSVAGTASGWVVAWQGGADVKLRPLDASGAGGTEVQVNDASHSGNQDTPAVAVLSTGAVAVLWHDSGNGGIFVQRYDGKLAPVAGDQGKRINDLTASDPSDEPALVSGNGAGGAFFAAAWVHRASGHVHARFLDGAGAFLFNPVDGQTSEFQVTRTDPSTPDARQNPAIAVGGAAPYVAIGWEDNSGAGNGGSGDKGLFARRFPVPLK